MDNLKLNSILQTLSQHTPEIYIVGGAVRDLMLGLTPKDFDIVTKLHPDKVIEIFSDGTHDVNLVGKSFGVVLVDNYEVACFREDFYSADRVRICGADSVKFSDTIEADVARRDFTCNAIACQMKEIHGRFNILNTFMVDPFNGQQDLKDKLIRFVGNPDERIKEDPLRMIRACRFAGKLGFRIESKSLDAIRSNVGLAEVIAPERIRLELMKMMEVYRPSRCIEEFRNCNLLEKILPDLFNCSLVGGEHGKYHKESIYEHCLLACNAVNKKYLLLRLAALYHDVAKPQTMIRDSSGDIHFHRHEQESAELVKKAMEKYKFSNKEIEYVYDLVINHMFFIVEETAKDSTYRRFLSRLKVSIRDLLRLRMADRRANLAKIGTPGAFKRLLGTIRRLEREDACLKIRDLKINGNTLIGMGFKPSRLFGVILDACLNLVLEDPSKNNREVLVEYVVKNFGSTIEK